MKFTLSILLLSCSLAFSQNLLVNFWPLNQPYQGLTNWPQGVKPVSYTNIDAGWATNWTVAQFTAYKAVQQPIYDAGVSNANWVASNSIQTNIAALQLAVSNLNADIPAFKNPNYSFVTNWANLQLGLMYIDTNLLHIATVLNTLAPCLTNLYNSSLHP